jgi:hypothetical protein
MAPIGATTFGVNVGMEIEVTVTEIEIVDVDGKYELKAELLVDVAIY